MLGFCLQSDNYFHIMLHTTSKNNLYPSLVDSTTFYLYKYPVYRQKWLFFNVKKTGQTFSRKGHIQVSSKCVILFLVRKKKETTYFSSAVTQETLWETFPASRNEYSWQVGNTSTRKDPVPNPPCGTGTELNPYSWTENTCLKIVTAMKHGTTYTRAPCTCAWLLCVQQTSLCRLNNAEMMCV